MSWKHSRQTHNPKIHNVNPHRLQPYLKYGALQISNLFSYKGLIDMLHWMFYAWPLSTYVYAANRKVEADINYINMAHNKFLT